MKERNNTNTSRKEENAEKKAIKTQTKQMKRANGANARSALNLACLLLLAPNVDSVSHSTAAAASLGARVFVCVAIEFLKESELSVRCHLSQWQWQWQKREKKRDEDSLLLSLSSS